MNELLSPRLQKCLERLEDSGGMRPYMDAPRQHRRLEEMGFIIRGTDGKRLIAVLLTEEVKNELDPDCEEIAENLKGAKNHEDDDPTE